MAKCTKCGVVLCDRNWVLDTKRKPKIYVRKKCHACIHNNTVMRYSYDDKKLEELSKKRLKCINTLLTYRRDKGVRAKSYRKKRYYSQKGTEAYKKYVNRKNRLRIEVLSDNYIKKLLYYTLKVETKNLTPELIEAKREQVKLKRLKKTWKSLTEEQKLQLKV